MEASFFYTNIQGLPYPGYEYDDYKEKGFNLKVRILPTHFWKDADISLMKLWLIIFFLAIKLTEVLSPENEKLKLFSLIKGWGNLKESSFPSKASVSYTHLRAHET